MPDNNYPTPDGGIDDPGPLSAIKWDDLEGRLVLATPYYTKELPSLDGGAMREVVFARVVVLDGPGAPQVWDDTPIYPRYLVGQLRGNAGSGRSNLGRVGKDEARKRPNQSAPWVLANATAAELAMAKQYLAEHPATLPARSADAPPASGTGGPGAVQLDLPPF